jgi:cytochrome c oxidase subunit III
MTHIPHTVEVRPDTGVNNVILGTWLFLASEVMLFGGLFSAYVLLRSGAESWPHGSEILNRSLGAIDTVVLLASTAAFAFARRRADGARARVLIGVSAAFCVLFLGIKTFEYTAELRRGMYPATSTFLALYYLLTAVHAFHVAGGAAVNAYLAFAGSRSTGFDVRRFRNRLSAMALYWYFVDLIWLCIFVLLYLG